MASLRTGLLRTRDGAPRARAARVRFLGGVGTVTGSCFLVETTRARVLVECGLFQGAKELRERNWEPLGVDPASIDAILLTHAHVDHSGAIPRIVRDGFEGPVWCTPATAALSQIVLPDCGHLQEEEAAFANRHGYSRHRPALPLYTAEDAVTSLESFRTAPVGQQFEVAAGVLARFSRAGHILGSASLQLDVEGKLLEFSGDLGRSSHPLLRPPEPPLGGGTIVIESTYGGRVHDEDPVPHLGATISRTLERGGVVLIPAFAVDRTEILLFHLRALQRARKIPEIPIYVDSPMALAALRVYRDAIRSHSDELRPQVTIDDLTPNRLIETPTVDGSIAIGGVRGGAVIISASGMATGGRILHHLAQRLPSRRHTVVLPGHQVEGTRGDRLARGEPELRLLGQVVPVRAEVVHLPGFSAHADHQELLSWLASAADRPRRVAIVHGEPASADRLRRDLERRLQLRSLAPHPDQELLLDASRTR